MVELIASTFTGVTRPAPASTCWNEHMPQCACGGQRITWNWLLSGHVDPLGRSQIVSLGNAFTHGARSPASDTALPKASQSLDVDRRVEGLGG